MNELHKDLNDTNNLELNKGQRGLLCSNKVPFRCPFLSLEKASSQDDTLDYMADMILEAFLDKKRYGK